MLEQIKKFLASIPEIIETFLDSKAFASLSGVISLTYELYPYYLPKSNARKQNL